MCDPMNELGNSTGACTAERVVVTLHSSIRL